MLHAALSAEPVDWITSSLSSTINLCVFSPSLPPSLPHYFLWAGAILMEVSEVHRLVQLELEENVSDSNVLRPTYKPALNHFNLCFLMFPP